VEKIHKETEILEKKRWIYGNEKLNKSNKNTAEIIISRQDQAEERISQMEDKIEEILNSESY
jgi:hypothetical protein